MLTGMLRYYFDVVCPYSYLLMPEVEAAEDAGAPEPGTVAAALAGWNGDAAGLAARLRAV